MKRLTDKFGRQITYLRLAITDRCNLRCQYCMPAAGIDIVDREELLTYKEMYRITRILSELGVNKVRLTGGEPFVRKDFVKFLESLSFNDHLDEINITTNGALISKYIPELEKIGIKKINLSIDTLQADKFKQITRRDLFAETWLTFEKLLASKLELKLNVVIQPGVNTNEIIDTDEVWNLEKIYTEIEKNYKNIIPLVDKKSSTSKNFRIQDYKGSFGIIPAFTRTICGDCNRIRLTATGMFKNCLFDEGVFNLRDFIRKGASDEEIAQLFIDTVQQKPENGFVAEANRKDKNVSESMSTIGG